MKNGNYLNDSSSNGKNMILRASRWVDSLWETAVPRWLDREGQDRSYRKHAIHPVIHSFLTDYIRNNPIHLLEVGCGDGGILEDRFEREFIMHVGRYLGIDKQPALIEQARECYSCVAVDFIIGDISSHETAHQLEKRNIRWNCAISVLTFQEIPDIASTMDNLSAILEKGSLALFIMVHPSFGEWLRSSGHLPVLQELTNTSSQWRWVGNYPIVDEPLEAFYLPYFHREIEDYRNILSQAGFTTREIIEFPDATHDLPSLVDCNVSPFYPFESNLYWPYIVEKPTSVAIIAEKE